MKLKDLVVTALKEDLPKGDLTTDALRCEKEKGSADLIAKQNLILSGSVPFEMTFKTAGKKTKLKWFYDDGAFIRTGEKIASIQGSLRTLLIAERTALNFLGHLSGIATLTSHFVEKTAGTKAKITDTRKTTPLLRALEKSAVLHGGGHNHRMNLSSGILIKENHIRTAGSITEAVKLCRVKNKRLPIEVEVTNATELSEALACKVERILLDNMTNEEISRAVGQIDGRCLIEASGNMTLDRIESVAKLGVDFISVGSLTHSAPTADVSLLFSLTK